MGLPVVGAVGADVDVDFLLSLRLRSLFVYKSRTLAKLYINKSATTLRKRSSTRSSIRSRKALNLQ
jgi:hypothetical protein